MAVQQYLPFALREIVVPPVDTDPNGVALPSTSMIRVSSSEIGFENPVHLGDISVVPITVGQTIPEASRLMMRVGWRGKGFILERGIQVGAWMNRGRPLTNAWRLEKPYYLAKNGVMQVLVRNFNTTADFQGIVFNCTREDNGKPYYLYGSTDAEISSTDVGWVGLRKDFLKAPPDTGLFIHSVSASGYSLNPVALTDTGIRIIGPNGYEWLRVSDLSGAALVAPSYYQGWLGTPSSMFELGSERGWIIQPKQALIIEFDNRTGLSVYLLVTIRGSVEV